jgi:CRISPR-associated protein Csd1
MYKKTAIRWIIELDGKGKYLGMVSTSDATRRNDRGKEFLAPHLLKTSGIKPKLLADNGEYVLGIPRKNKKSKPDRVAESHRAFQELIKLTYDNLKDHEAKEKVGAVLAFLKNKAKLALSPPEDFDPSHIVTFRVDGVLPFDLGPVQRYWEEFTRKAGDEKPGTDHPADVMQCLICGEEKPAVRRLPFKIKLRSVGGQSSGNALISANSPAFESYGLEESLIAPTCSECGELFSKAVNALIEGEQTHIRVGPLMYIFWTKEDTGFSISTLLTDPQPGEVKALIASAFKGNEGATGIDTVPFYATAFSASGARAAVRDWLDTTVGRVQRNLAHYFRLQQIVDWSGEEGNPLGLYALAGATVRDLRTELTPNVPKILLHTALKGGPLPMWLLYQAVKRNRAEQAVTRPRIALIKMVLLSQPDTTIKEDAMVQLDTENQNPAYLCGRLFAVLEAIQARAIPGAGATIVDRFFGTASSAPASVFGLLLSRSQAHLGKLRRERRGTYIALQQKLEEIQSKLDSFPKTLTLEGQGFFSLGYYHQRASDRAGAAEYLRAKEELEEESNEMEGGKDNE